MQAIPGLVIVPATNHIEAKTKMTTFETIDLQVLRLVDVEHQIGLKRSTIYDWMNPNSPRYDSMFPKPIKLGKRAVGWRKSDLAQWLEQRESRA